MLVTADDVFDRKVLKTIQTLGSRLEKEVPKAGTVFSLLTMPVPIGTEDGIEISNPFGQGIPADDKSLSEIKKFFLGRQSVVNTFLSEDSKETWIILPLGDIRHDIYRIIHIARDIVNEEAEKSAGFNRICCHAFYADCTRPLYSWSHFLASGTQESARIPLF